MAEVKRYSYFNIISVFGWQWKSVAFANASTAVNIFILLFIIIIYVWHVTFKWQNSFIFNDDDGRRSRATKQCTNKTQWKEELLTAGDHNEQRKKNFFFSLSFEIDLRFVRIWVCASEEIVFVLNWRSFDSPKILDIARATRTTFQIRSLLDYLGFFLLHRHHLRSLFPVLPYRLRHLLW